MISALFIGQSYTLKLCILEHLSTYNIHWDVLVQSVHLMNQITMSNITHTLTHPSWMNMQPCLKPQAITWLLESKASKLQTYNLAIANRFKLFVLEHIKWQIQTIKGDRTILKLKTFCTCIYFLETRYIRMHKIKCKTTKETELSMKYNYAVHTR